MRNIELDTVLKSKPVKIGLWTVLPIVILLIPLFCRDTPYLLHVFNLTLIYIIATVSFRAISISGQFPMAHAAFMGVGAYFVGIVSTMVGLQPWLTIPLAALFTGGLGALLGYPFCRLRSLYYALGSLFLSVAIMYFVISISWSGGFQGLFGIQPIFTGPPSKTLYFYFLLGLVVITLLALWRFEFSRIGMSLKAIDQSDIAARHVGINAVKYKVLAIGVGCFFVGLAGAAYGHYVLSLSVYNFNLNTSLWMVMYVLIGGIKRFPGPIIGTMVLFIIPELARDFKSYTPFVAAALLIIIVYFMPEGLSGLPKMIRSWYSNRLKKLKSTAG